MKKQKEEISVVVPVYNLNDYIENCLKSIIIQTYKELEIIVINDGSNDNSEKIIKDLQKKDKRIKYFYQENKGPGSARNLGISASNGKWITFVDGDDTIEKTFIENLYQAAINFNSDLSLCNYMVKNEPKTNDPIFIKNLSSKREIAEIMLRDMWKEKICTFTSFGKLIKTGIIKKLNLKFPEDINNAEDLIFFINYWTQVSRVSYIHNTLYIKSKRENSLSKKSIQVKDVRKGRAIFNKELISFIQKNELNDLLPKAKNKNLLQNK